MAFITYPMRRLIPDDPDDLASLETIELVETVAYVYLAPIIIVAGMIGSLANLVALSRKHFCGRFNVYLKGRRRKGPAGLSEKRSTFNRLGGSFFFRVSCAYKINKNNQAFIAN